MTELRRTDPADLFAVARARTPARLFAGCAGTAYRTATFLDLRRDHAAARDAVNAELALSQLPADFVARFDLFEVKTLASSKEEFLLRPDRGRSLDHSSQSTVSRQCPAGVDLQIAVGDGLSAMAVVAQVPVLVPLLFDGAKKRNWSLGRPFLIRYSRVGVINDLGDLLRAAVVVLLIGERPGLATAESLSAYMAYRPRAGDTDAKRNLISNIHARGISPLAAADRILNLAAQMMARRASGVGIKETLTQLPC